MLQRGASARFGFAVTAYAWPCLHCYPLPAQSLHQAFFHLLIITESNNLDSYLGQLAGWLGNQEQVRGGNRRATTEQTTSSFSLQAWRTPLGVNWGLQVPWHSLSPQDLWLVRHSHQRDQTGVSLAQKVKGKLAQRKLVFHLWTATATRMVGQEAVPSLPELSHW